MSTPLDVTLPSDREIVITRRFDAPPALVFDCHTAPALVQRWMLGPPGWTMPVCDIDLRVGGDYRYRWRSEAGDKEFGISGTFREIDPPGRIVHSERMEDQPGEMLCTTAFDPDGAGTLMTMTMLFPSQEVRDQALASGMTDGMSIGYERLDSLMADQAAGRA